MPLVHKSWGVLRIGSWCVKSEGGWSVRGQDGWGLGGSREIHLVVLEMWEDRRKEWQGEVSCW